MGFPSEPKSTFTFLIYSVFYHLKLQQPRCYLSSVEETAVSFLLVCCKDTAIWKQDGRHHAMYSSKEKSNKI